VTQPADNVATVLCTIESCSSHSQRDNVALGCCPWFNNPPTISDDLPAWSQITDSIIIWNYTTNYCNYNMYFPNLSVMLDDVRFYAENNVIGIYEQGNGQSDCAEFPELRAYIISKILWDPYMTEEEYWGHIDDFLEGFYGPGWTYIREYIDMVEGMFEDKCIHIYNGPGTEQMFFTFDEVTVNPKGTYPEELTEEMIRTGSADACVTCCLR